MRLALIHSSSGTPAPARSLTWKTCRREVHILDDPSDHLPSDALTDAAAYCLLLEIVCGLHSPIVGETEVQAQFKAFASVATTSGRAALARLCQHVLRDAKLVRHRHLQGFGARSYGALTLEHVTGHRLVVVGTGALAAEIVIAAIDRPVDLWGRRAPTLAPLIEPRVRFHLLSEEQTGRCLENSSIVVACPIDATALDTVTASYERILKIVDLRAAEERTPSPAAIPVITLDDLVGGERGIAPNDLVRIAAARRDIRSLSAAFANRIDVRPYGWDDLCA